VLETGVGDDHRAIAAAGDKKLINSFVIPTAHRSYKHNYNHIL
jgi:hypothetical protein